jgi:hypothetical protein
MVKIRLSIKVCLLLSGISLVAAMFSYFYEASSMGLLPVINYPLRVYTIPLSIFGLFFLFSSLALYRFSREEK